MPTYRLGLLSTAAAGPRRFPRVLLCDDCHEGLGVVDSEAGPEVFLGMSAERVAEFWPELAADVRRHEARCRGPGGRG